VSSVVWRSQPPEESEEPAEEGKEAEVVNLAARRLREWLKGLVGMPPPPPQQPPER
jgi:hypothetical protein